MDAPPFRPLQGLRVLDFSTLLPGPLASLMLAEAGAEVTKIERPGVGDDLRSYEPAIGGESVLFALLNRGKSSLALDLKNPADNARAKELAAQADIVVEQFRPGVMDRLGLGYQAVAAANPGVIYCSITGYGQTGPRADAAGHDLNFMAEMGLLSVVADGEGTPVLPHTLLADLGGGAHPAVINILLALRERDATGRGRHLDIAMAQNLGPFLLRALANTLANGDTPPNTDLTTGGSARYAIYRTRDGRFIAAAPLEEKFWANFTEVLGLSVDVDRADIVRAIGARDAAELMAALSARDTCCSLVATVSEAMADPHNRARGVFARSVEIGSGAIAALPLPLIEGYRDPEPDGRAPELG
jgi:crotonobetainyl-CoA:carnitine CoA-transferase CaiB-like acyl-CoA transferase